ncbi:MAG: LysM peptidoglycan-binding domain-containing protein [Planctomycetota bacterium]|nr:LysM peptidoglycan-binding domain-containing protein [Planctomycetota bacterium]MDA1261344.1 LysM peptidoglycan-binding domain-containing protein [Planctomycetota bacterium]
MTREHKLAVVLGFGLLLFVGILVSDHFSATQRRNPADLAANTIREVRPAAPISIQTIQVNNRPGMNAGGGQMPASGDTVALPNGLIPASFTQPVAVGVPAELHTLKDGETLYKICQTKYGNGNLWKELADFNKSTISNPTKLRKGTTIRLPSASVLRGEVPAVAVAPIVPAQQLPAVTDPNQQLQQQVQPVEQSTTREYVIQKGDTLGAIAARELGTSKKWELIYDANRDRIKGPSDLKIGKPLRIPYDI